MYMVERVYEAGLGAGSGSCRISFFVCWLVGKLWFKVGDWRRWCVYVELAGGAKSWRSSLRNGAGEAGSSR